MCQTRIQQQQRRVRQLWWLSSLPVVPLLLLLLLFILAIGTTVTAAAIIEDGSRPQMAANASNNANQQLQIRFDPFCPSNEYRCGAFAEQRGPQTDPAMRLLHRAQNALIRALSQPFPHQKLLSDQALAGEPEEWKRSLIEHRQQVRQATDASQKKNTIFNLREGIFKILPFILFLCFFFAVVAICTLVACVCCSACAGAARVRAPLPVHSLLHVPVSEGQKEGGRSSSRQQ